MSKDGAVSFWRNNDVITPCVCWEGTRKTAAVAMMLIHFSQNIPFLASGRLNI